MSAADITLGEGITVPEGTSSAALATRRGNCTRRRVGAVIDFTGASQCPPIHAENGNRGHS